MRPFLAPIPNYFVACAGSPAVNHNNVAPFAITSSSLVSHQSLTGRHGDDVDVHYPATHHRLTLTSRPQVHARPSTAGLFSLLLLGGAAQKKRAPQCTVLRRQMRPRIF